MKKQKPNKKMLKTNVFPDSVLTTSLCNKLQESERSKTMNGIVA